MRRPRQGTRTVTLSGSSGLIRCPVVPTALTRMPSRTTEFTNIRKSSFDPIATRLSAALLNSGP
jgi:hypothetical protein